MRYVVWVRNGTRLDVAPQFVASPAHCSGVWTDQVRDALWTRTDKADHASTKIVRAMLASTPYLLTVDKMNPGSGFRVPAPPLKSAMLKAAKMSGPDDDGDDGLMASVPLIPADPTRNTPNMRAFNKAVREGRVVRRVPSGTPKHMRLRELD